jgi:glycosyltransferase involved in cell wall biosynthesis
MRVAESFATTADRVEVIPHIKDIRSWYDFSDDAWDFTEQYQRIMSANIIQIYPCSTDRLEAKQLDAIIKIFGFMKLRGTQDVFLCAANQWATGRQRKEDVNIYIQKAIDAGLEPGIDFVFTSEYKEEFGTGISKRLLRELQLLQNVFIFPTKEESFGLVGPEAAFSGALPIINKSLTMQFEVMSTHAPAFDFGSFHQDTPNMESEDYINAIANAVLNRLYNNEAIMTKLYCRKRYNMDDIYTRYYLPLFC